MWTAPYLCEKFSHYFSLIRQMQPWSPSNRSLSHSPLLRSRVSLLTMEANIQVISLTTTTSSPESASSTSHLLNTSSSSLISASNNSSFGVLSQDSNSASNFASALVEDRSADEPKLKKSKCSEVGASFPRTFLELIWNLSGVFQRLSFCNFKASFSLLLPYPEEL